MWSRGSGDGTWGFLCLNETGVTLHLLWIKVRTRTISPLQTGAVPAWWEPAGEAVPVAGVDRGYLKVRRAGNNQADANVVRVGAAGGAIRASQVRQDTQGVTPSQNKAGRSEDGAENPGEKVQSLVRATSSCQQRETQAEQYPSGAHPCRVSLPCRTCPAEAGVTESFGVSLPDIYLFLHLGASWSMEELPGKQQQER